MSIDIGEYIGIPYVRGGREIESGLDCYGLIRLLYNKEFNIELPQYEKYVSDGRKIINSGKTAHDLSDDFYIVDKPMVGDVLMFTVGGIPLHIGLYLDNNNMLHSFESGNSCVERWQSSKWQKRFYAAYRHIGRDI